MTGWLFGSALAGLPLVGYPFARLRVFSTLTPAARWGLASGAGSLALCVSMLLTTALHVRWSVWLLLLPSAAAMLVPGDRFRDRPAGPEPRPALALAALASILGVVAYAAGTARATAADFVLFWGTKGERFARARAIDVGFLRDPLHYLIHPDYPPLVPGLYAWGTLIAGRFAWRTALLSFPLFVAFAAITLYGFARPALGRRVALENACLLAVLLGFLGVANMVAGDAEPELFLFEVLALAALVFAGRSAAGLAAAAVGLAGAVLTKVEGTVFAVLVVGAYTVLGDSASRSRARTMAVMGLPPAAALVSWLLFCRQNGLLDIFRLGARTRLTPGELPIVVRELVRYDLFGPRLAAWAVVGALLIARRPPRAAVFPLAVAAGFLGFMVYMYLSGKGDPTLWIQWSAARLSMTPLVCCLIATMQPAAGDLY
ncbi:MAG TPA: hypothetical protein VGK26_10890 [Thermoanaerobaculia bacterium]|jgi:hypothetical protein